MAQPNKVMRLPQRNQEQFSFELRWTELRMGLVLIFEHAEQGLSNEMWVDCYSTVYKICAFHKEYTQNLYQQLVIFCSQYSSSLLSIISGTNDSQELLDKNSYSNLGILDRYCSLWLRYQTAATYTTQIFQYMSKVWARINSKVKDVYSLIISSWRDNVYNLIRNELRESIFFEINLQRKNEISSYSNILSLFSVLINNFIELGIDDGKFEFYKHEFEEPFLASTSNYYFIYSSAFLDSNSVVDYLKQVEEIIEYERKFSKQHLHPSTEQELIATCKKALIDRHFPKILEEFQLMIKTLRTQDMRRVYSLSKHLPEGIKELALSLKLWANSMFKGITRDQTQSLNAQSSIKNAVPLIHSILALHRKCKEYILECFEDNPIFLFKMDESFIEFMNRPMGIFKMAELLCMFCDRLLCGKEKISGENFDDTLERLVKIFSYLNDKDLFHESYRRSLSRRLLTRSNRINEDMESAMLSNIKLNCGAQFTTKLEGMFNDIMLSNEINEYYREYHKERDLPWYSELQVNVLNSLHWPLSPSEGSTPILASVFGQMKVAFENFYSKTTPNKNLIWIYHEGTVVLTAHFTKRIEIILSTFQAAIVMLFNDKDKINIEGIMIGTNLKIEEIQYSLYPLINSKYPLFKIESNTRFQDIIPSTTIELNPQIGNKWPLKMNFPPGSANIVEKEAYTTRDSVNQDRRYQIDAAIMRIMKSRRFMNFNELLVEVSKHLLLYFNPDPKLVKQRVQALIEQEFLEKDISQPDVYKYLA